MKKNSIIFYIVTVLIICLGLVIDVCTDFCKGLIDSNIIGIALSFLTIIFSLWFSYLLVIKQIYSNRYSNNVVAKYVYSGRNCLVTHFFVLLFIGFFLLIFAEAYFFSSIIYIINSIIFVFLCGKNIYKKISEEEIKKAICEKVNVIFDGIEKNNACDEVEKALFELKDIYDEAYLKNEISTCRYVLSAYYEFFNKFIENRNKNIIQDDASTKNILNSLILFYENLFKKDTSILANELNGFVLNIVYKLARICIKCDIDSLLIDLLNSINHSLSMWSGVNAEMVDDIYRYIFMLEKEIIEADKVLLFDKILYKAKQIFYFAKFETGRANYISFLRSYVSGILLCLKLKKEEYYSKIYSDFEKYILSEITVENRENFCIVLSQLIMKKEIQEDSKAKQDFFETIKKLANNRTIYDNQFFSFLSYVVNKYKEMGDSDSAFNLQYLYSKNIVEFLSDSPNYIFPEFSEKVNKILMDEDKNKELSKQLDMLLGKAIDKNRINWVGLLLSEVINCLKCTAQQNKNVQLIWISLFQNAAERVSCKNNSLIQEMVIRYYRLAILEMDKLRIISKDLGNRIIENLKNLCEGIYRENLDFVCDVVELLNELLEDKHSLQFVNLNKEIKEKIYKSLFHIAVDSIEKNQDLVIKRISNIIGWRIKEMIEKGHTGLANDLIDYALKMYNLSRNNRIKFQTIVFMGTLFIIIGAYSSTDPKYYTYRSRIIKTLTADPSNKVFLEVSKKLRSAETLGWEHLLGANPVANIQKFWNEYNKES